MCMLCQLKNQAGLRLFLLSLMLVLCPLFLDAAQLPAGQGPAADIPIGQSAAEPPAGQAQIDAEVMGSKGGYLHPFLLVEGQYTDNLYYTGTGEEDDFITSFAPGIWIALPSNREKLIEIQTANTSPGGLRVSRIKPETTRRMQTYLLYSPTFVYYANHSEHNHTDHRAEGLFQYNFNMGLSIDLLDQFNRTNEINNNAAGRLDQYDDNLLNLLLSYEPSEKFKLRLDLSDYRLDYDDPANDFRDRIDQSLSLYLFYKFKPKTSIFAEYDLADIDYDQPIIYDSREHRYYIGLDWDVTAKTRGRAKAGLIKKSFDQAGVSDAGGFSLEIQAQHNFSPKRALSLNLFRHYTESYDADAYAVLTTGADLSLLQRFNAKWSATLNGYFTRDEFEGVYTLGGRTDARTDDTFRLGAILLFDPRDWMSFDLGYYYTERDSNFDAYDFKNNTIFLSLDLIF